MVQVQTEKDLEKQPQDQLEIVHEVAVTKNAAQNLNLKKSLFVSLFGFFLLIIVVITLSILLNMRASRSSICTSKSCIRAGNELESLLRLVFVIFIFHISSQSHLGEYGPSR